LNDPKTPDHIQAASERYLSLADKKPEILYDTVFSGIKKNAPEEFKKNIIDTLDNEYKELSEKILQGDFTPKQTSKSTIPGEVLSMEEAKDNAMRRSLKEYIESSFDTQKEKINQNLNKVFELPLNDEKYNRLKQQNIQNEQLLSENPELADQRLQQTEKVFAPKQKSVEPIKLRKTNLELINPEYKRSIADLEKAFELAKDDNTKELINDSIEALEQGATPEELGLKVTLSKSLGSSNDLDFIKRQAESQKTINDLERDLSGAKFKEIKNALNRGVTSRQPVVEMADFSTPKEKVIDTGIKYLKELDANPYAFAQEKIISPASKILGYAAIPIAGYDLGKKMFQSGEDIRKAQEEKGVARDLSETGLDMAILGSPLAKLARATATSPAGAARAGAIAAGLDIAALPLGGYLAGKLVEDLMGGPVAEYLTPEEREKDIAALDAKLKASGTTEPLVIGPEQDMDKMYNYSKIKNLLKK
jgi:hypothetical protein